MPRWCAAAEGGLERALGDYAQDIRDGVSAGRIELWRVGEGSWLVTEARGDTLIAWCYQGRGVQQVTAALFNIAKRNGLEVIEFETRRPGLARLLHRFGFDLAAVDPEGISRFQALVTGQ